MTPRLQTRTSALGIRLEDSPSSSKLNETDLSRLAQSVHCNALHAAGSAHCPPMSVSVTCARGCLQLILTGVSLESDEQPEQRPELLAALLAAARSGKPQGGAGGNSLPRSREAPPPPLPPSRPPPPPPPSSPPPLPQPPDSPASAPSALESGSTADQQRGAMPGRSEGPSEASAGASRSERTGSQHRAGNGGSGGSGGLSGSMPHMLAPGEPWRPATKPESAAAPHPALAHDPSPRRSAPEVERQKSEEVLSSQSGTPIAVATKDDISALFDMLLPQSITQGPEVTSLSATAPAAPGGSATVSVPAQEVRAGVGRRLPLPCAAPKEGAAIRLVRPWLVRCHDSAPPAPPGGVMPPQPGASGGTGGAQADAPAGAAFPHEAAAQEVQLEIFTSQALDPGTHEVIISYSGRVLLRHECDGEEAAEGWVKVSLPAPEVEGVMQVRLLMC